MVDICVVGSGPAGLTAALALAHAGADVACLGPPPGRPAPSATRDTRTAALLLSSVRLLANLGVWEACAGAAAPLRAIRIIDDTRRLLRAPEVAFEASELGAEAFGYNVPNAALVAALAARAADERGGVRLIPGAAAEVAPRAGGVRVRLADGGELRARLVVGADGRESLCRRAAGIEADRWDYAQTAIACNVAHAAAHDNVCTELHREAGPLTTVPLPGRSSSLVWVERPEEAGRLMGLGEEAFARVLEQRLQGLLGAVESVGPRAAFPLSGLTARAMARARVALVGEAAHVIPPIGAQGLNLGFRDAAALADCVAEALQAGRDLGGDEALAAYAAARAGDVRACALAVDVLNRSLLTGLLPVQAARGLALHLAGTVGPLRRFLMRQGMGEPDALPRLMRSMP